jgi:hydrogenase expression/formation protein HypD
MEVCGTHTMSISRYGIRSLLPETITLLSGPGCPVCVTSQGEIDRFIRLSRIEKVIVATFGDLLRVPSADATLEKERAAGADIRMVYSTLDALEIAADNPDKEVVFLGIGFETTAPTIAAAVLDAQKKGIHNFSVLSAHKRVIPALEALLQHEQVKVHGFICPGHVSVIIGGDAYRPLSETYHIPCAVAGFEPVDILQAVYMLVQQIEKGGAQVEIAYRRGVTFEGNRKAREIMARVFEPCDAVWRGIGPIPQSGYRLRAAFSAFDAEKKFALPVQDAREPEGCACGEILVGIKSPRQCSRFGKTCTPAHPVGPCMVSSEGTCAAYYKYQTPNAKY